MARIDWSVICDGAFFDRDNRLCIIGITKTFAVSNLPTTIGQTMIVARLTDIQPVEELAISFGVLTPSGVWTTPTDGDGVEIELHGEYVLATLRAVPLLEAGVYVFHLMLRGQPTVTIDAPVITTQRLERAQMH